MKIILNSSLINKITIKLIIMFSSCGHKSCCSELKLSHIEIVYSLQKNGQYPCRNLLVHSPFTDISKCTTTQQNAICNSLKHM